MMQKYLEQRQKELNNNNNHVILESKSHSGSPKSQRSPASSTIAYKLFMYREELRKPQGHHLKLSKSKLNLTQDLVSHSVDRITEYDVDELMVINRQIYFSRQLKNHMDHMRHMQKIYSSQAKSPQKAKLRSSG